MGAPYLSVMDPLLYWLSTICLINSSTSMALYISYLCMPLKCISQAQSLFLTSELLYPTFFFIIKFRYLTGSFKFIILTSTTFVLVTNLTNLNLFPNHPIFHIWLFSNFSILINDKSTCLVSHTSGYISPPTAYSILFNSNSNLSVFYPFQPSYSSYHHVLPSV